MESTDPQLTAARHDLILGDLQLLLSPLTDQDITELTMYTAKVYMKSVRDSLEGETRQWVRDETIEIALRVSTTMHAFSRLGIKILASVDGMSRVVWQQCHRNNPQVTIAQIKEKLAADPENLRQANIVFTKSNSHPAVKGTSEKK